jgi:hypothetical protein
MTMAAIGIAHFNVLSETMFRVRLTGAVTVFRRECFPMISR